MKTKLLILITFLSFSFSQVNAQYFWQVQSVTSISGGGTYNQNDTPNDILLNLQQCSGGGSKPHNLTNYTLTWYVNSTNSNSGGTVYSTSTETTTVNFNPTLTFTPPTDVGGTFYYYAEFSNPSMTTCGFTSTLTSPTEQVIVNSTLSTNEFETNSLIKIYPNPTKQDINIALQDSNISSLRVMDILGKEVYSKNNINTKEYKVKLDKSPGLYFLEITDDNGITVNKKIFKK